MPAVVVVSAVFMGSMSWMFLLHRPSHATAVAFAVVGVACWLYFLVDYLIRVCLARNRGWFVRARWPDLLLIVLTILPHLHFLRVIALVIVVHHLAMRSLRNQVMTYTLFVTTVLVWGIALNVMVVERDVRGSTIRTLGDAVWWAVTSVTTVGYGDLYPITGIGRVLGGVLVVGGVALIGVWTASFANWLFSRATVPSAPAAVAPATAPASTADAAVPLTTAAAPTPVIPPGNPEPGSAFDTDDERVEIAALLCEVRALRAELAQIRRVQDPAAS